MAAMDEDTRALKQVAERDLGAAMGRGSRFGQGKVGRKLEKRSMPGTKSQDLHHHAMRQQGGTNGWLHTIACFGDESRDVMPISVRPSSSEQTGASRHIPHAF